MSSHPRLPASLPPFMFCRPPTVCCGLFSTCHGTLAPKGGCWRRSERSCLPTRIHVENTSRACLSSKPASKSLWGTVGQAEEEGGGTLSPQLPYQMQHVLADNPQEMPGLPGSCRQLSIRFTGNCLWVLSTWEKKCLSFPKNVGFKPESQKRHVTRWD